MCCKTTHENLCKKWGHWFTHIKCVETTHLFFQCIHRDICRDRPGYSEICSPALERPIRRKVAEGIRIGVMARDSIKIDLTFDLKIELMTENSALLLYTFTILYPFDVPQFVLLFLSHKQALYRNIAILYNTHYYTVWQFLPYCMVITSPRTGSLS